MIWIEYLEVAVIINRVTSYRLLRQEVVPVSDKNRMDFGHLGSPKVIDLHIYSQTVLGDPYGASKHEDQVAEHTVISLKKNTIQFESGA